MPQAHPVELSIDDCRFSIERRASNRKSKIDNRKFPGGFMIPERGGLANATGSSRGASHTTGSKLAENRNQDGAFRRRKKS